MPCGTLLRLKILLRTLAVRDLGRAGEIAAQLYMKSSGLLPVARNWRGRNGELDLVLVTRTNELVIAEVKTTLLGLEEAWSRIDPAKEEHLADTASEYLASHGLGSAYPYRFDVIVVHGDPRSLRSRLRFLWTKGVF